MIFLFLFFCPPSLTAARRYDSMENSTIYNVRAICGQTTPTSWTSSPWRHRIYDTIVIHPRNTHLIKKTGATAATSVAEKKTCWWSYQRPCNLLMATGFSVTKGNITWKTKQCRQRLWANCFQTLGDIRRRSDSSLAPLQQSIRARSVAQGAPSQHRHSECYNLDYLSSLNG